MSNPYSMPQADLVERAGADTYMPKFFSLSGRIGRVRYLAYGFGAGLLMVPVMLLLGGLGALTGSAAGNAGSALGAIGGIVGYLLYLAAILSQVRRRLHDLGKTGWMGLLMIVPLVNIIFGLWLLFGRGDEGANDYGPAPAPNTTGVVVLAWILPFIMIIGMLAAIAIPAYKGYTDKAHAAQIRDSQ